MGSISYYRGICASTFLYVSETLNGSRVYGAECIRAKRVRVSIFITIFVIFVLTSRHAQEIFVSLMNLIIKKPFFTLRTPTFDFY